MKFLCLKCRKNWTGEPVCGDCAETPYEWRPDPPLEEEPEPVSDIKRDMYAIHYRIYASYGMADTPVNGWSFVATKNNKDAGGHVHVWSLSDEEVEQLREWEAGQSEVEILSIQKIKHNETERRDLDKP